MLALTAIRAFAAPEVMIGVSPYLSAEQRHAVQAAVRDSALQAAPLSTRVLLWDAWNLTNVVTPDVPRPTVIKKDSVAARLIRLKPALDKSEALWYRISEPET